MKRKFLSVIPLLAASAFFLGIQDCSQTPNQGIVIGNPGGKPNLEGKSVRIVPESGDENYVVTIVDADKAEVSRVEKADADAVLEKVLVPYTQTAATFRLAAAFSNGTHLETQATVNGGGAVISGTLTINDQPVNACFDDPTSATACDPTPSPASNLPSRLSADNPPPTQGLTPLAAIPNLPSGTSDGPNTVTQAEVSNEGALAGMVPSGSSTVTMAETSSPPLMPDRSTTTSIAIRASQLPPYETPTTPDQ